MNKSGKASTNVVTIRKVSFGPFRWFCQTKMIVTVYFESDGGEEGRAYLCADNVFVNVEFG